MTQRRWTATNPKDSAISLLDPWASIDPTLETPSVIKYEQSWSIFLGVEYAAGVYLRNK